MLGILLMLFALSFAVMIHEFGHFIIAKKKGLLVTDFSIGFGPTLFSFKKGETTYSFKAILFGGYVLMPDDVGTDTAKLIEETTGIKDIPYERTYNSLKPRWQAALAFAGPFVNLVFGFILLLSVAFVSGFSEASSDTYFTTYEGTPLYEAGFRTGDKIQSIRIEGSNDIVFVAEFSDLINQLTEWKDHDVVCFTAVSKPEKCVTRENGKFGIAQYVTKVKYGVGQTIQKVTVQTFEVSTQIVRAFGDMVVELFTGKGINDNIAGPIGIIAAGPQIINQGFEYFIMLLAMLSLNFFVLNLFPFPPLDGSKILFAGYEGVTKKKPSKKFMQTVTTVGFVLFLALFVLMAFNDLGRLIK